MHVYLKLSPKLEIMLHVTHLTMHKQHCRVSPPISASAFAVTHAIACRSLAKPARLRKINFQRTRLPVATGAFRPTGLPPSAEPVAPPEAAPSTSGRKILFAVDGTEDAEEALRWLVKQIARKGDTVHLAHVICDPRTPATAVGSSAAATQWSPARDEQVYAREFFLRMEHEAQAMLATRFIPSLQFTGVEHAAHLLRMRLHKSAAGIGEALANRASDVQADFMVVASHGSGVLADYGSVARWCSENSRVPAFLIPPAVLRSSSVPSNTVVVAAVDDAAGLRRCFDFALRTLTKPGDNLYVMHAKGVESEAAAVAARKRLVADVLRWQEESEVAHAGTLNVAVDLIQEEAAAGSSSSGSEGKAEDGIGSAVSRAGERLCAYAADLNARAVVLHHHGKSMMRDMMFGPITAHCTRHCTRPLLLVGATDPLEGSVASMGD